MKKVHKAIIHVWRQPDFWKHKLSACGLFIQRVGPPFATTLWNKKIINCKRCLKIMGKEGK